MMVGIDQAGQQHQIRGIEFLIDGRNRLRAERDQFDNGRAANQDTAAGILGVGGKDRAWIFNPDGLRHRRVPLVWRDQNTECRVWKARSTRAANRLDMQLRYPASMQWRAMVD